MTTITVGVLTPHGAAGAEAEFPRMTGGRVRTLLARIHGDDGEPPNSPDGLRALATPARLDAAAAGLVRDGAEVLAHASTSTGYALGPDGEAALVRRLGERWAVPVHATARSAVAALRAHRVERLDVVHPPWFDRRSHELGAGYFRDQGFEVTGARRADLPDDPARIEPAMVVDWVARHLSPRADAVFLGGNGFRAAEAVRELEDRTGRLVLEANQVLLWSLGAPVDVRGFGRLFAAQR